MRLCMRTTIDIEDKLLALAKKYAVDKKTTLKAVIESALRKSLLESSRSDRPFHLMWKTVRGKRLPGVDISDRDSLYEKMESRM